MFYVKLYLLTLPLFLGIDLLWLGLVARGFYRRALHGFLAPQVNWTAAIVFYALYVVGILVFAVVPAIERDSAMRAAILGGLFGFFTYATYDLTNLATLEGWPLTVVAVDIAWGTVLCATVAAGGFLIARQLNG